MGKIKSLIPTIIDPIGLFHGGGLMGLAAPDPPKAPDPPPVPDVPEIEAGAMNIDKDSATGKAKGKTGGGRQSTILTGELGLPTIRKKTLLGQ